MSGAGMNTVAGLYRALKGRLGDVALLFPRMETRSGQRTLKVIDGWLPPRQDREEEHFPFLALRPINGEDSVVGQDQNARATMEIGIGTFSDTDDGFLDVALIIDAIRHSLGSAPRIEDTAFEHVGPLRWEILVPEQQPRPQWLGFVTTIWDLPRPRPAED